jgi:hypothetical protein
MASEQVACAVDEAGFEPSFPERSSPFVDQVDGPYIAAADVLERCRSGAGLIGRNEQMHVVAHQNVSMDLAAARDGSLLQALQVEAPIQVTEEAGRPVVAALHDVQRDARGFYASRSRHCVVRSEVVEDPLTREAAKS